MGQVACHALRGGVTRREIELEIAKCDQPEGEKRSSAAMEALLAAARELENSNQMFDADAAFLERFSALALSLAAAGRLIARFARPVAIATVALTALRQVASERLTQITAQRAANDAAIRVVRRAAANEANFLRTGTR